MNIIQKKLFLWLLCTILISMILGCTASPENREATTYQPSETTPGLVTVISIPVDLTKTPKPTRTPEKIPTPNPTLSVGFHPITYPLPDILINTTDERYKFCGVQPTNQIWYSEYPYDDAMLLLGDDEYNYNFPVWSPDGEWIAYIRSKSQETGEGARSGHQTGGDQVWLIRLDGSEAQPVGIELPNIRYHWADGCQQISSIATPPSWSPEGDYLIVQHDQMVNGGFENSYYLINVGTGETSLLLTQNRRGAPLWVDANTVAILTDNNELFLVYINGQSLESEYQPIAVANDEGVEYSFVDTPEIGIDTLTIADYELIKESEFENPKIKFHSLWEFDLRTKSWKETQKIDRILQLTPTLGMSSGLACETAESLVTIDPTDWQTLNSIQFDGDINCSDLDYLQDNAGEDLFSIIAWSDFGNSENEEGIMVVNPSTQNPKLELMIRLFDLVSDQSLNILEYDWRNISGIVP